MQEGFGLVLRGSEMRVNRGLPSRIASLPDDLGHERWARGDVVEATQRVL